MGVRIDRELVLHVAGLAHLELSEDEITYYCAHLGKILEHVAVLDSIPDPVAAPTGAVSDRFGPGTPERDDDVAASLAPSDALAAAPRVVGTAFQVPRIIE